MRTIHAGVRHERSGMDRCVNSRNSMEYRASRMSNAVVISATSVCSFFNAAVSIGHCSGQGCEVVFSCLAPSALQGTTVAGYGNGSSGSDSTGLSGPDGIYISEKNVLYVAEFLNHRVRRFPYGFRNGTTVAGTGVDGSSSAQLSYPSSIFFDEKTRGLYVADMGNHRIQLWHQNATTGISVAGAGGDLSMPFGVRLDKISTMYVSDAGNSRVMRWTANATGNGTIVVGGTRGAGAWSFNFSRHMDFDRTYTYLYIVDNLNHRVQRYNLVNTSLAPVTVAGGNSPGASHNQLNQPNSIFVSRKTGALYITDAYNHRVQRWSRGATSGVTIAGSTNGTQGNSATLLRYPSGIALDATETFLYVAEWGNHRVQRFPLIG